MARFMVRSCLSYDSSPCEPGGKGLGPSPFRSVQIPPLKKPFPSPLNADLIHDRHESSRIPVSLCDLFEIEPYRDVVPIKYVRAIVTRRYFGLAHHGTARPSFAEDRGRW